jgi:tether containing UBX domain for GLUT4
MSVSVELPSGKRQTVRVTPGTILASVRDEAVASAGVPGSAAGWRLTIMESRKKVDVDLSLPFRLSGIQRGAKLNLEPSTAGARRKKVTVGLQLPGGERIQREFESTATVAEVLKEFSQQCGADLLQGEPTVTYLSSVVKPDAFAGTTLASMGLAGGSGLLRVTFGGSDPVVEVPKAPVADAEMSEAPAPSAADNNNEQVTSKSEQGSSDNNNDAEATEGGAPVLAPRVILAEVRDAMVDLQDREVDDSFYEHTLADVARELADVKRAEGGREQLMTRKHWDAQKKAVPVFSKTTIRVRFSDRTELEGNFHPSNNTVGDVVAFVRSTLRYPEAQFSLFTAPPKKVLAEMSTLQAAELVPLALVHVSFQKGLPDGVGTGGRDVMRPEFVETHAIDAAELRPEAQRTAAGAEGQSASASSAPKKSQGKKKGVPGAWFRR